jgi:hypothetical protein
MREAADKCLPTLERALSEGLDVPMIEPPAQHRLAMLVVHAVVQRRTSWAEETLRGQVMVSDLESGPPPVPDRFEPRHWVRLDADFGGETCKACVEMPGRKRCRICNGQGQLFNGAFPCSCQNGSVACPSCEGTTISKRVRVRYYTDTPASLYEAYLPAQIACEPSLFHLKSTIDHLVHIQTELPEELRCHDLSGRVAGTAYRGGERKVRPDFHGHDFGDTIEKALGALAALGGGATVIRYDIRAYAWPLLWLRYPDREVVVYPDREGKMRSFG